MLFLTIKHLFLYINDRFPVILILIPTLLNVMVLQRLLDLDLGVYYWSVILVAMALYFGIRVYDDYRDYEYDIIHHKERVLQRGMISIKQISIVKYSIYMITSYYISPLLLILYSIFEIALRVISQVSQLCKTFWVRNLVLSLSNLFVLGVIYVTVLYQFEWNYNYMLLLQHVAISFSGSYLLELIRKIDKNEVDGYRHNTTLPMLRVLLILPIFIIQLLSFELYLLPITFILVLLILQNRYQSIKKLSYFYYIICLILMLI